MNPEVSVVMPVYNGERYLQESIESILKQTFTDFEFIIINDGSTDRSGEIIKSYHDQRIRLIENESNLGLTISLNKGLSSASGEYIARMDADDISLPERFAKQVDFLKTHPDIGVLGSGVQFIDHHGTPSSILQYPSEHGLLQWYLYFLNPIIHSTVMMRRKIVETVGGYNPERTDPHAEDYELWDGLSNVTRLWNLNEVLLYYRLHQHSYSNVYFSAHRENDKRITQMMIERTLQKEIKPDISAECLLLYQNSALVSQRYQISRLLYQLYKATIKKSQFTRQDKQLLHSEVLRQLLDLAVCYQTSKIWRWQMLFQICRLKPSISWQLVKGKFSKAASKNFRIPEFCKSSIIKKLIKYLYQTLFHHPQPDESSFLEPLQYRVHLYEDLISLTSKQYFRGKRILEIGPKDGLDSKRLALFEPCELIMIDLLEKKGANLKWLPTLTCPYQYIEANFMYMPQQEFHALGKFDLIWCTGVLYHNAEQMRFLRKLYKSLNVGGYFVLESATLRLAETLREEVYVEIHYPKTYRDTGTITHLPTARAIKAWLQMVGFRVIHDSKCYQPHNKDIIGQRYACICKKNDIDESDIYYGKSGLNPKYHFGDST